MGCIISRFNGMHDHIYKLSKSQCRKLGISTDNCYIVKKEFRHTFNNIIIPVGFCCDLCSAPFIPKYINWNKFLMHDFIYYTHAYRIGGHEVTKKEADEVLTYLATNVLSITNLDERAWKYSHSEYLDGNKRIIPESNPNFKKLIQI